MDTLELNADFHQRTSVHGAGLDWVPSPMAGVERRMLERIGNEVARATTIFKYAPQSQFSSHIHTGGEEFLVLDGVFQDEHGDFPAGSYIRNPPQSSHTPGSHEGCTILVKLWQMTPSDRTHIRADTNKLGFYEVVGRENAKIAPLFRDEREEVRVEIWSPSKTISYQPSGGMEIFVLDGEFEEGGEAFSKESWLRLPKGQDISATAGPEGARVWIKEGHLAHLHTEAFAVL